MSDNNTPDTNEVLDWYSLAMLDQEVDELHALLRIMGRAARRTQEIMAGTTDKLQYDWKFIETKSFVDISFSYTINSLDDSKNTNYSMHIRHEKERTQGFRDWLIYMKGKLHEIRPAIDIQERERIERLKAICRVANDAKKKGWL